MCERDDIGEKMTKKGWKSPKLVLFFTLIVSCKKFEPPFRPEMSNLIHFFAQYPYHIHFVQPKLVFTPSGQLQSRQELHLWDPWSLLLTSDICLKWGAAIWKVTRTTYLVKENNFWQAQATPWYLSWSSCVHFIPNKCFHLSNSNSSRLLHTSDICLKWGAATSGSQRWSSWQLLSWPEGVKTSFCWTKCMWQGYFAKKNGSNCSFLAGMVVQTFYIRV